MGRGLVLQHAFPVVGVCICREFFFRREFLGPCNLVLCNQQLVLLRPDFVLLVCAAAELLELRQQFEDGRKRLAALKVGLPVGTGCSGRPGELC